MEPDGHLEITPSDGSPIYIIYFIDIKGHHPEPYGLRIEFLTHRFILPWTSIKELRIFFNSPEYQAWIDAENAKIIQDWKEGRVSLQPGIVSGDRI